MTPIRRALAAVSLTALALAGRAPTTKEAPRCPPPPRTATTTTTIAANGTTLHVERRGAGRAPAAGPRRRRGRRDARRPGREPRRRRLRGRHVRPSRHRPLGPRGLARRRADQHADDAAALIDELGWADPTVVGVSSGGVIALDLAARHPDAVGRVVAWEPPAAGVIPGGAEASAAIMAPVEAHLADHPGDFVGAQAILLAAVLGCPGRPSTTPRSPPPGPTPSRSCATSRRSPRPPSTRPALAGPTSRSASARRRTSWWRRPSTSSTGWTGRPPVQVDADHEVYLADPSVLTGIVTAGRT